jgi:hypothetical protein
MAEVKQDEPIKLSLFKNSQIQPNSIISIIGKNTNLKAIYTDYKKFFDSPTQLKNIMDNLKDGEALVIDETSPRNRIEDLLYIYDMS